MGLPLKPFKKANGSYLRMFLRFTVSYIIILVIPMILMGGLTYTKYHSILNNKVGDSSSVLLSQVRDIIDVRLNEFLQMPIQINRSSNLASLLTAQDMSRFGPYRIYQSIKELNSFMALNDFIDDIAIYIEDEETFITTSIMTDSQTYLEKIYYYANMPVNEYKDKMLKTTGISIWPAQPVKKGFNSYYDSLITYVRPLFVENSRITSNIKLIITIKESAVRGLLKMSLDKYKGSAYILDSSGKAIVSVGKPLSPAIYPAVSLHKAKSSTSTFTAHIDNEKMLISMIPYERLGWNYVSVIPYRQAFSQVNMIRDISIQIIIVTLLIGIILALYFTYRNYSPVRNLLNILFPESESFPEAKYGNEWAAIEKQILQTIDSKKILEYQMKNQRSALRENYVRTLIMDESLNENSRNAILDSLGVDMPFAEYSILLFHITIRKTLSNPEEKPPMELCRFVVSNVVEELCQVSGRGYSTHTGDDVVAVLLCFKPGNEACSKERMLEIAQRALKFIESQFNFIVTVGLGKVYDDLSRIRNSLGEASMALEYRIIKGKSIVIDFEEINVSHEFINYYSLDDEKLVVDYLKRGDINGIREILSRIVKKLNEYLPSLRTVHCVFFEIISTAMHIAEKADFKDYGTQPVNSRILNLLQCTTIDELHNEIVSFYEEVCDYMRGRKESKNYLLANNIIQYLNNNCYKKELSLKMVAGAFDISTSYLSRFFKDHFGYNFIEYLQMQRLRKAKMLLKDPSRTICSIASEVGYENVHSFINTFKKYEGITPGLYRNNGLA